MKLSFKITIRIFLHLILAIAVSAFLYASIVPDGRISYATDFNDQSPFIGQLTPQERLDPTSTDTDIVGEPVYFSLRTPRRFDKAILSIRYRNDSPAPLIEAGVLDDKRVWNYDLKPVENKLIQSLSEKWHTVRGNGLLLLQKENNYGSVDEFLKDLPPNDQIALYNYDLKKDYRMPAYEPSTNGTEISVPLRGAYQFYTYLKNETLDFEFTLSDLNLNRDSDPVDIILYKDGAVIDVWHLDDDGITSDTGEKKPQRKIQVRKATLPEGVYRIELKTNNDIITKTIISKQSKLAFINKVWIADSDNSNETLFTDSKVMTAETTNPGKLQNIVFSGRKLAVTETFKQFGLRAMKNVSEIKLAKDDVILAGDGMFSFTEQELFNPTITKLNGNSDVNRDGINYILADYDAPLADGAWRVAQAEFDLTKAYRENGKYSFLISIPKLGTPDFQGKVVIDGLKIDLEGKDIFTFIKKYLTRLQYGE